MYIYKVLPDTKNNTMNILYFNNYDTITPKLTTYINNYNDNIKRYSTSLQINYKLGETFNKEKKFTELFYKFLIFYYDKIRYEYYIHKSELLENILEVCKNHDKDKDKYLHILINSVSKILLHDIKNTTQETLFTNSSKPNNILFNEFCNKMISDISDSDTTKDLSNSTTSLNSVNSLNSSSPKKDYNFLKALLNKDKYNDPTFDKTHMEYFYKHNCKCINAAIESILTDINIKNIFTNISVESATSKFIDIYYVNHMDVTGDNYMNTLSKLVKCETYYTDGSTKYIINPNENLDLLYKLNRNSPLYYYYMYIHTYCTKVKSNNNNNMITTSCPILFMYIHCKTVYYMNLDYVIKSINLDDFDIPSYIEFIYNLLIAKIILIYNNKSEILNLFDEYYINIDPTSIVEIMSVIKLHYNNIYINEHTIKFIEHVYFTNNNFEIIKTYHENSKNVINKICIGYKVLQYPFENINEDEIYKLFLLFDIVYAKHCVYMYHIDMLSPFQYNDILLDYYKIKFSDTIYNPPEIYYRFDLNNEIFKDSSIVTNVTLVHLTDFDAPYYKDNSINLNIFNLNKYINMSLFKEYTSIIGIINNVIVFERKSHKYEQYIDFNIIGNFNDVRIFKNIDNFVLYSKEHDLILYSGAKIYSLFLNPTNYNNFTITGDISKFK